MVETYFEHYVLAGGWAMLLLVPASVLALVTLVRGMLMLRAERLVGDSQELESGQSPLGRIVARLARIRSGSADVARADMRAELEAELIDLYSFFQPLGVIFVLAPFVGLLGSIGALMSANLDVALGGSAEALAAATERALVPAMWGIAVGALAYASLALLRARLYSCERDVLRPALEAHLAQKESPPLAKRSLRERRAAVAPSDGEEEP